MRPLRMLYGETVASAFGPRKLKVVREEMLRSGLSRKEINRRIGLIKRLFRWGVAEELVAADVRHRLDAVENLQRGQSSAREPEPVRPVEWGDVDAVLPHLSRQVCAMVLLQWWSGMRPGEVCSLQTGDSRSAYRL